MADDLEPAERPRSTARPGAWRRRAITLPAFFLIGAFLLANLPFLLLLALLYDLTLGRRLGAVRTLLMGAVYVVADTIGLASAGIAWVATHVKPVDGPTWQRWHHRIKVRWARTLKAFASFLFQIRWEVHGTLAVEATPCLIFMRHASLGDTLIGPTLLEDPHGIRCRYVLKRELLVEPAMDIIGQRLRAYFVDRSGHDPATQRRHVADLAEDLGPEEAVLIYPEGTRFTEAKRSRILDKLEQAGDAEGLAYARSLHHVLPPRMGGPLALLARRPDLDVVFVAHTGLEKVVHLTDLLHGHAFGTTVRVDTWRVPAHTIPTDPAERAAWLRRQWTQMDAFVLGQHLEDAGGPGLSPREGVLDGASAP